VRNHRWRSTPKYLMLSRPPPPSSSLLIILLPLALTLAGVIWVKHPPLSVPPPGAGLTRAGTVWTPSYSAGKGGVDRKGKESWMDRRVLRMEGGGGRRAKGCEVRSTVVADGTLTELMQDSGSGERIIFCGGKGGVGKTTTASAVGVKLAEEGHATLVVSTDPAHSLGDALDVDLRGGSAVSVGDPMGIPLYAMEIDAEKALKSFSEAIQGLDLVGVAQEAGISPDMLESVGVSDVLKDLSGLFENPPPGIDEIIAIAQVLKLVKKGIPGAGKVDRIVFDTAPTGHTLRLLSLPNFLDGFVGQAIKLRARLGGVLNSITSLLGMENTFESKLGKVVEKLESFQTDMQTLKMILRDPAKTEFVVVTIPTTMAVKESERLINSLSKSEIATKHIVVNKVLSAENEGEYLQNIQMAQDQCLRRLESLQSQGVKITNVPYFDSEVTGVPALQHMARVAYRTGWEDLAVAQKKAPEEESIEEKLKRLEMEIEVEASGPKEPSFLIMGGKGGVGKTSSAASLAIHLAEQGAKTVVVSTDPAHSLGDSLQVDLTGNLQRISGTEGSGELYAMEVDTDNAIRQFRDTVREMVEARERKSSSGNGGVDLLGQLKLEEFLETLETPPPGADELVALAQMLQIVNRGTPGAGEPFDYVVVDTAPTGHTLRLLSLPEFLNKFFARLRNIRDKVGGATSLLSMFMGPEENTDPYGIPDIPEVKIDRLEELQKSMEKVTSLLKNNEQTQFCIVTIPTQLAVAETERLVSALAKEGIAVNHIIANQVLDSGGEGQNAYLTRISREQQIMLDRVDDVAQREALNVVKVPYFDAEVRSVFGLKVLGDALIPDQ
ncbi:hypothetical protein AAMO2058_000408700, partial [Amorphochlora amoebiformis]